MFHLESFPALLLALAFSAGAATPQLEPLPNDAAFERLRPLKAAAPSKLILSKGDRLAICGDSITEQKMYSRIIETYLTVCVPELDIAVRQYGWSGERAPGFLARMTNDCLRFVPTVATTCYGMNDHEYRIYESRIGDTYRDTSLAIARAFKSNGVRLIQGSPGSIGKRPPWSKDTNATVADLNFNLCELRNIGVEIAASEGAGFADVFLPMLKADVEAQRKYGSDYAVPGKDGVHPGWSGQLIMAYAFLKSFGLDGGLGTFTVDLEKGTASASAGHQVVSSDASGTFEFRSERYPFCAAGGEVSKDDNIRSGMSLVPFQSELNRFTLVVRNATAERYRVTWGAETKAYTAADLKRGINLADEFHVNPFSEAFAKVDSAVAAKQAYETRQIKELFHGPEGRADMDLTVQLTEKVRAPLAAAIKKAFVPITHTIRLAAE